MNFPDARGLRIPKRHPACPGKRRCKLPSCIHNAPVSGIPADETPVDLYEDNGDNDGYPSVTCVRDGTSYRRLDAASELGSDDREIDHEPTATICRKVFIVQAKIQKMRRAGERPSKKGTDRTVQAENLFKNDLVED